MTEAEWLACEEPERMLEFLPMLTYFGGRVSKRKLRLLAGQFCLSYWSLYPNSHRCESTRTIAVEVSENGILPEWVVEPQSDDLPSILLHDDAMRAVVGVVWPLTRWVRSDCYEEYLFRGDFDEAAGRDVIQRNLDAFYEKAQNRISTLRVVLAQLLREIVGNPFRPATLDPSWLTPTVTALAAQMYDSRDFSAMPILADALQDAGCTNDDILNHCRGDGPHVRGCWVVDLVVGKE